MSKFGEAIKDFKSIDELSRGEGPLGKINPLVKLILTLLFIVLTVSHNKYDLAGTIVMAVFPAMVFILGGISFRQALKRLKVVLPIVCLIGVLEPFFDTASLALTENLVIRGGIISGLTLMVKGVLAVLGGYLLVATTPIEGTCSALRKIHIPNIIVTVILLIYRYMGILLSEGKRVVDAYSLRAPGQKGIAFSAWGPLVGQMLIRSIDRAENLYQSMQLRGFNGQVPYGDSVGIKKSDIIYFAVGVACLILLRWIPFI